MDAPLVIGLSLAGLHGMLLAGFVLSVHRDARIRRARAARAAHNLAKLNRKASGIRRTHVPVVRIGA